MIAVKDSVAFKLLEVYPDELGRYIILVADFNNMTMTLVNIMHLTRELLDLLIEC